MNRKKEREREAAIGSYFKKALTLISGYRGSY